MTFIALIVKDKAINFYLLSLFLLFVLLISFRDEAINDDSLNYYYYFSSQGNFDNFIDLYYDSNYIKIEVGYKFILHYIEKLNGLGGVYTFYGVFSIVNFILYIAISNTLGRYALVFIHLYISFFFIQFEFATLRYALASLIFLLAYASKLKENRYIYLIIIASLIHYSVLIFSIIFLYYEIIIRIMKKGRGNYFLITLPYLIFILMYEYIVPSMDFNIYYKSLIINNEFKFSPRIIVELTIMSIIYFSFKYKNHLAILILAYVLSSFIEVYTGIFVLNRLRVIVWLLFLYIIAKNWNLINNFNRNVIVLYSLLFFTQQINYSYNWIK